MKQKILLFVFISVLFSLKIQASEITHKVDSNGNVVFSITVEGLPFSQKEIFNAAKEYLTESYKITRYEITSEFENEAIIIGSGKINSLYEHSNLVNTYVFNADFSLRFDGKDGRMRIQFIIKDYTVLNIKEAGSKKHYEVQVSSVAPISDNDKDKKTFKKVFATLESYVQRIFDSASESVKNYQSTENITTEDW